VLQNLDCGVDLVLTHERGTVGIQEGGDANERRVYSGRRFDNHF
jgi:hypothetical protein